MKVLITREIPEAGIKMLQEHSQIELDYRKEAPLTKEELIEAIKGVDALIPVIPDQINSEILKAGNPTLKIVAHFAVGYDNIDVEAATKLGIFVSNTPGNLTESVAEEALALLMAVGKKIVIADKYIREGKFKYWEPMNFIGQKMMGKTLGIVGFGRIGQHLARICKFGFQMKILYHDVAEIKVEGLEDAKRVSMDELLNQSDIVSLHCNLTKESTHLVGMNELKKMKPEAIVINTSRGPVINEEALVTALKEGWIFGAGLDVFEHEPTVHPELLKLDNVVLTPHIASATWEARIQMARMAAQNIIDVLIDNKLPTNLVNKELTNSLI